MSAQAKPASNPISDASLVELGTPPHPGARSIARAQNFVVEWLDSRHTASITAESDHEMLLLLPECGAAVRGGGPDTEAPQALKARTVCILPAGRYRIDLDGVGVATLIASQRGDLASADIVNDADYTPPDERIVPYLPGFKRTDDTRRIHVIDIDKVVPPAGKPRLKMFQTETLSINWVEYDGPRDRAQLSPHRHINFEQGSLSMAGNYVHHLRTPWGENANVWREDRHQQAGLASLLVVPVLLIHTTEGVGPGKHLLIDIFSPPRRDFIASGWVANAADYADPTPKA